MTHKLEFASPAYVDELARQLRQGLADADLTGIDFTMSQEYTNPPGHLRHAESASIGFYYRIRGGRLEVGYQPLADATVRVIADYQAMLEPARTPHGPNPAEDRQTLQTMAELTAAGRFRMEGSLSDIPAIIAQLNLHDRMAGRTA